MGGGGGCDDNGYDDDSGDAFVSTKITTEKAEPCIR